MSTKWKEMSQNLMLAEKQVSMDFLKYFFLKFSFPVRFHFHITSLANKRFQYDKFKQFHF